MANKFENINEVTEDKVEKGIHKNGEEQKIYIDLGNFSYKMIFDNGTKKSLDFSNVEQVEEGTYGAFKVNGKSYIFGPNAKIKYDTNKICEDKKALLGRALYPLVNDKEKVKVVTLLPLSLYISSKDENKKDFQDLLKGKYTVSNASGYEKTFTVTDVEVYCESYSSIVLDETIIYKPLYLVDLGGVDWSGVFVYKLPDVNKKFNNTTGMNSFYSKLGEKLTSAMRKTYDPINARLVFEKFSTTTNEDLEKISNPEEKERKQNIKSVIDSFSKDYIKKNIYDELYKIGYDEDVHQLLFVGGGAETLRKYLEEDSNVRIFDNAVYANIEGARKMSIQNARRKNKSQSQAKDGR
jgi:hypothetical protein